MCLTVAGHRLSKRLGVIAQFLAPLLLGGFASSRSLCRCQHRQQPFSNHLTKMPARDVVHALLQQECQALALDIQESLGEERAVLARLSSPATAARGPWVALRDSQAATTQDSQRPMRAAKDEKKSEEHRRRDTTFVEDDKADIQIRALLKELGEHALSKRPDHPHLSSLSSSEYLEYFAQSSASYDESSCSSLISFGSFLDSESI